MNASNSIPDYSSGKDIPDGLELKKQAIQFFETLKALVDDIFDSIFEDEEVVRRMLKEKESTISRLVSDLEVIRYIYAGNTKSVGGLDLNILGEKTRREVSGALGVDFHVGSYFESTPVVIRDFLSKLEKGQTPTILELQLLSSVIGLSHGLCLPLLMRETELRRGDANKRGY